MTRQRGEELWTPLYGERLEALVIFLLPHFTRTAGSRSAGRTQIQFDRRDSLSSSRKGITNPIPRAKNPPRLTADLVDHRGL